jgi:hypothetical protein
VTELLFIYHLFATCIGLGYVKQSIKQERNKDLQTFYRNYIIATFTIKYKSYLRVVSLVVLVIGSVIFFKYKKNSFSE